ncbi:MAG: lytic transglycosylase domain-containing protein [Acidobacteriota bacterium]
MRLSSVMVLGVALVAGGAVADVRMAVKRDGSKVIYNVGGVPGGAKGADLDWLARRHDRRSKYDDIIERYAARYGVDPTLVRAVIQVESDFNAATVSNKGARGLMQLMPETAKRFGVTKVHDPDENIHGGVKYLAYLTKLFPYDLPRALAAYNAGEGAVRKHGGIPPYAETESYVKRAMTVYHGRPYGGGGGVSFAGRRGGKKLRGGFGTGAAVAAALIPGARYLGLVAAH